MPLPRLILYAAAATILCAAASAAFADGEGLAVMLEAPLARGDSLAATWSISNLLDDETRRSLESGVGAELVITIEAWRKRRLWFGSLAASRTFEYSAWLDEHNRRFELHERGGGTSRAFASVDELERFVSSPTTVGVIAAADLGPTSRYTIAVSVELRPLTLEAMRSIEWWMKGEPSRGGSLPGSGITRRITSIAADLSGFGKRTASARTDEFRGDITPAPAQDSGAAPAVVPNVGELHEPRAREDREERHDRHAVAHRAP
ncbi:MAG: DUF4390 domain-containing protein [bacterium]